MLLNKAGKNASYAFEQASHSANAKTNQMPKYAIGKIDPNSIMQDWQKEEVANGPSIFVTVTLIIAVLVAIYYLAG